MLAERLAALAIEGQAGRIHEHGGKIGEQVAAAIEQLFLDRVLDATRRERLSTSSSASSPSQAIAR